LIATILSAQCTDERVNIVTQELFRAYPDAKAMARADVGDLEQLVKSTGFFKNKAKNIKAASEKLVREYPDGLPKTIDELTHLPGVGRKTANVVLGNAFAIASGVVVDTHVTRLSNRLGLVKGEDAVKIAKELEQLIDQSDWIMFSHWLITHGRTVCKARKPQCSTCFLYEHCPQLGVTVAG
jgi:endonuclease-3